jgi:hypothetical protein
MSIKERAIREQQRAQDLGYRAYFEQLEKRKAKLYWWILPLIFVVGFFFGHAFAG